MERLLTLYSEVQSTDVRWLGMMRIKGWLVSILACRVIEALDMDVSKFYHGDYYLEEEVKTMRGKGVASRKKSSI